MINKGQNNLFKRMQNQVKRISKKILVVKQQFTKRNYLSAKKSKVKSDRKYNNHIHSTSNYTTARVNDSPRLNKFVLMKIPYNNTNNNSPTRKQKSFSYQKNHQLYQKNIDQAATPQRQNIISEYNCNTARGGTYSNNQKYHIMNNKNDIYDKNTQKIKKFFNLTNDNIKQNNNSNLNNLFQDKKNTHINSINLVKKLKQQNFNLQQQIVTMQALCSERCYKLGYMKAYYRQNTKVLEQQKDNLMKQNIYFEYLLDFYKSKAKQFKKRLQNTSQILD